MPDVFDIIYQINAKLCGELMARKLDCSRMSIIQGKLIHMANLAVYCSRYVNGVAALHTEILKSDVLKEWYAAFPEKFQNKTNGITQRRWLGLCNPELCDFLDARIGKGYLSDLEQIAQLKEHLSDRDVEQFNEIKRIKKQQLSRLIQEKEGVYLPPDFLFDVQVKRMHEYKRQLLNAFGILDTYFGLKDGRIKDFTPTAYIFGAKARRAISAPRRSSSTSTNSPSGSIPTPIWRTKCALCSCRTTTALMLSTSFPRGRFRADLSRGHGSQRHGQHEAHAQRCGDPRYV